MPRKGPAPKRPLVVDPVYGSQVVTQLVSKVLQGRQEGCCPAHRLHRPRRLSREDRLRPGRHPQARVDNVKPAIEVKSRRVGGATYQVPVEVKTNRQTTLALRWLVGYAADRREKTMAERLMNEILDASNGLGAAVKKREDTHKMAESNKAFAHYRW
ncbi:30S ribosomal protein S7 [Nocardioides sp. B-3]|uniref:30S ribosomal protein S7 n=1 Tax=Nocardioides sp. B-3 TaxID=2895565 RepID=UPI002152C013|nr:30S ribosomal protein S7 [Nocardioides sp. B-3]UUZ57824.1 30S ribosomal protein S7 [Nocardioides sp. B-3]